MKEKGTCLFELLADVIEKKRQQDAVRLYSRFIEIIKKENPSPYQLLFILELIKWNILKEIITRAERRE